MDVAKSSQRKQVMEVLAEFLTQSSEATDHFWLAELSDKVFPSMEQNADGHECR